MAVLGNRLLDPEEARSTSGAVGQNALLVRTEGIEQAVERVSVVQRAQAILALPGRLEIDVTERTPVVQWQARDGSFLVDREGVVFSREPPPHPVIVVRNGDGAPMEVGSRVDPSIVASIEALDGALPEHAGFRPSGYDYSEGSGVSVSAPGGPRLVFGDAAGLNSKLAALAAVRGHLEATKATAETIDLRFEGRPVLVLASKAPAKAPQAR